ncbi:hypothetical protein D3C74_379620 [compost metagenome]
MFTFNPPVPQHLTFLRRKPIQEFDGPDRVFSINGYADTISIKAHILKIFALKAVIQRYRIESVSHVVLASTFKGIFRIAESPKRIKHR